jgi:DNA-binding winged helix-turn-helix (wHTH) protein
MLTPLVIADGYFFEEYTLNPITYTLYHKGKEKHVSPVLFELLCTFVQHPQQLLSRDELFTLSNKSHHVIEGRRIDTAVTRLRQVLNDNNPDHHRFIKTIRTKGYLFLPKVREIAVQPFHHNTTGAMYD